MSRRGSLGRLAGGTAIGVLAAATGLAQVDPPGGIDLGFLVNQGIIFSDNPTLEADPDGTTIRSDTSLGFRLSSQTRLDTLALTGSTTYRYADGPGISENGFTDPVFTLSYDRLGANSAASADFSYRDSDIAFIRPLSDFVDDDGVPVPPEDADELEGTGQRVDLRGSASLAVGLQGSLGATLTLGASETDYVNVTDPDLVDVSRRNADLDLRFALTPVLDATANLGYVEIDPADDTSFETQSLDVGLDLQRPAGSYSAAVGVTRLDDGEEYSLSLGRRITLPTGAIAATVGAVRDPDGETALTGSLSVDRTLRTGALAFALSRSSRTTDDGRRLVTSLSARYSRPLTTRTNLALDAAYLLSEDTAADTETAGGAVGATLGYELTRDWSLSLGYQYRSSSESDGPDAQENAVSLGLTRDFTFPIR